MEQASLDQGLEMRLEHLASRIESLKAQAEGFEKIDEIGRLDQLEHRYKDLENRMQELNREGPGFRHEMKNELEKLSYDLSGAIDEFIMWVDFWLPSGQAPVRLRPLQQHRQIWHRRQMARR